MLLQNLPKLILISATYFLLCLVFSTATFASPLSWQNTFSNDGKAGFIKFSSALSGTIFASFNSVGSYDILKSVDNGQNWISIKGDLPEANDINWIGDFNQDGNVIAVSLWGSGIFLTRDGGSNWNNIYPSNTPLVVEIDPQNLNKIYVGIGGGNNSQSGLYLSNDGGSSWNKVSAMGDRNIGQIHFDSENNQRIFVSADPNYYRTTDGGNNWTQLSIDHAFSKGTVIDAVDRSLIFTARFDVDEGVYASNNNGDNWVWKNAGPSGKLFQLVQDSNRDLYATRIASNPNGGVWRSSDGAESWENVQDPAWGNANTWGLDAKNGKVVVSVEGLGIFVADDSVSVTPTPTPTTTPTPSPTPSPTVAPGPNPIVVVPGFGGSFSTKAIILHQPTVQSDWEMMPYQAPSIYNPFLNALSRLHYLRDDKVFFFAYDFTKPIAFSAEWLDDYLTMVSSKNDGRKVEVVGHSMGGLVARFCFESVPGCKDKINKIVSAGAPNRGAVDAYFLWEGADFSTLDPLSRLGATLLLHTYGFPALKHAEIIHDKLPGVRDFLPVFDYISGKPYSTMSDLGKNPTLENLPVSRDYFLRTLALSGNRVLSTPNGFDTKKTNFLDKKLGLWIDGKPKKKTFGDGDGTVLNISSRVRFATNKSYPISHTEYLNSDAPVSDILQFLGISPIGPIPFSEQKSVSVYFVADPEVEIKTVAGTGEEVVQPDPNVIFVKGGKTGERKLDLKSEKDGAFEIGGFYFDQFKSSEVKPVKVKLLKGVLKNITSRFK